MKKVAVMQPYFLPYLGYFQLICTVDHFVVLDDVTFIKKGWISRNYILNKGEKHLISLPLRSISQNRTLRDHRLVPDSKPKLLKTIFHCYRRANSFSTGFPLTERLILGQSENLVEYLLDQLRALASIFKPDQIFSCSSDIPNEASLTGQDRIIQICKEVNASQYVNLPGGAGLYDEASFLKSGLELRFLEPKLQPYRQLSKEFVPRLSIVDLLMNVPFADYLGYIQDVNLD